MLIITHVYGTGPPQDLEEYLRGRTASLLVIGHPFPYASDRRSFWRCYQEGRLRDQGHALNWRGPEILFYIKDAMLTWYWSRRHGKKFDLIIGAGGFNAVLGLIIKLTGRAEKVIFYCIDWMPQRFNNLFLNNLYHLLDRVAVTCSDRIWNLSGRMADERSRRGIRHPEKQIVVPVGIWRHRFPRKASSNRTALTVVYMGHVRAGQGVQLLTAAWPRIVAMKVTASLAILGDGPLRQPLQEKMRLTAAAKSISWYGFVPDHRDLEKILSQCDIAVAMYEPGTFTQYTDPGKVKVYLAAGLPIVMTNIGASAAMIERHKAGMVIPYEEEALVHAIGRLAAKPRLRAEMSEAAKQLARQYDWEKIFPEALMQSW